MRPIPNHALASRAARLLCAAACLTLPRPAAAELMLNPTRLVFGPNQRAAQVELINSGSDVASYRITLVNRRMTETGEFESVTQAASGELFAHSMLSYSPRQVSLQPGTAQVVRVMLRKPDSLAPGEYRSHLHFEKLPAPGGAASIEQQAPGAQIGVVLTTLIGASIPIIVRHGSSAARVTLTDLGLRQGGAGPGAPPMLAFRIERSGDNSVYGDIEVTWSAAGHGQSQGQGQGQNEAVVGKASGVAVYSPNPLRRAAIALALPPGAVLARGSLRLTYRERAEAGAAVLAQATLALP